MEHDDGAILKIDIGIRYLPTMYYYLNFLQKHAMYTNGISIPVFFIHMFSFIFVWSTLNPANE